MVREGVVRPGRRAEGAVKGPCGGVEWAVRTMEWAASAVQRSIAMWRAAGTVEWAVGAVQRPVGAV